MTATPTRPTLLLVDDAPANIDVLRAALEDQYRLRVAVDGPRALELAQAEPPDLILLDVMMPDMDGFEVCRRLKRDDRTRRVPVIFVTALLGPDEEKRGFEAGAADYLIKPISPAVVRARVRTYLEFNAQGKHLQHVEQLLWDTTELLARERIKWLESLGRAVSARLGDGGGRVHRVGQIVFRLARELGLSQREAELMRNAVPLLDVGMLRVPDRIIQGTHPLSDADRSIMQAHAKGGADIIGEHKDPMLDAAYQAAWTHHERWDGTGYPRGLAGEKIPLVGRIAALCDVFDSMLSARPYRTVRSDDETRKYISERAGKHFDPQIAACFNSIFSDLVELRRPHA
jgi:putative two-component system response regulator